MSKFPLQSPSSSLSAPSTSTLEDLDSRLAESQLLSELAQAAESTMVSTRSHDHLFESKDLKVQPKIATAALRSNKRRLEGKPDDTLKQNTSKRQRSHGETANAIAQKHGPASTRGSGKSSSADREVQVAIDGSDRSRKKEVSALAKHRRFGSEESEVNAELESQSAAANEDVELEDDVDSDDAPEAVTAAAGFEASRAAAMDAAKTAKIQQSALRAKRREHDARLKAQAEAAKSQQHPKTSDEAMTGATNLKTDKETHALEYQTRPKKSTKTALPALLPDELLAEEPVVRAPRCPSPVGRHTVSKKTKLLDIDSNGPKDVKRGNRRIRVVHVERSILPPKSSTASKAIREKWLTGERGSLGAAGVPRRKLGGGFIRR